MMKIKEQQKTVNQQAIDKIKLREHLEKLSQKRQINQKQLLWNLDSLVIPEEIEELFPNKVALFKQMRAFERDMKTYIKSKVTNIKEDILRRS